MESTASDYLLAQLQSEGVDAVFGIPGGNIAAMMQALRRHPSIRFLVASHEGGAAFMADGYARATGKLGVCLVIAGPGILNALTGVASAHLDQVPLLVVSGQVRTDQFGLAAMQESTDAGGVNTVELMRHATAFSMAVVDAASFPRLLGRALRTAQASPGAGVHLSIPANVARRKLAPDQAPAPRGSFRSAAPAAGADLLPDRADVDGLVVRSGGGRQVRPARTGGSGGHRRRRLRHERQRSAHGGAVQADRLRARFEDADDAMFFGNRKHRVLAAGESLTTLTARAARAALAEANLPPEKVDRLYGHVSPSELIAPNELYRVHRELGLPEQMPVVPIQAEYNAFLLGLQHAWEAILCGRARSVLAVVGAGFTLSADDEQEYAQSVGDGAGAAVIGPSERLAIIDVESDTWSRDYGALTVQPRPETGLARPLFRFEPGRTAALVDTTREMPPRLMKRLLDRHGLAGNDITLITHQNTRKIMGAWRESVRPRDHLDTYEDLGNMQLASVPVTLARHKDALATPYLMLFSMGMTGNMTAALLRV